MTRETVFRVFLLPCSASLTTSRTRTITVQLRPLPATRIGALPLLPFHPLQRESRLRLLAVRTRHSKQTYALWEFPTTAMRLQHGASASCNHGRTRWGKQE